MGKLRSFYRKYLHSYIGICILLSFLITLITETVAHKAIYGGVVFLVQHPFGFLVNMLIVFACLALGLLFRHRVFVTVCVSVLWLALGGVNGIILANRMTPFTTGDLMELADGISLIKNYLSTWQIVLVFAAIAGCVAMVIILFNTAPILKEKIQYKRAIPVFLLIVGITLGCTALGVKSGALETYFPNLAYGYRDNGFNYCFLATWLDKGVKRPIDYSEASIKKIFTEKEWKTTVGNKKPDGTSQKNAVKSGKNETEKTPNIIFLQLESFMDPQTVKGITLSEDAIPNFRQLTKNYSTGRFQVPSMGAGTANTEFENMTGMSAKFFGPGEYPYKTVLRNKTIESIPFNLQDIGYSTHAIHNHRAAFYNRNKVLGHLGFQTFTSLEYMSDVSKTLKNWARDNVLTKQIQDALASTEGPDYIYTISVQGHGRYPTKEIIRDPEIVVNKADTVELKWQWEYYVNQIHEMDVFVKELTDTLKDYDENIVLVMYGDHLPAIDNLTEENLKDGRNIYQTDYVIWSNFKMEKEDKDLYAYQIGAELLDRLNIHNGTMVTYHQNHRQDKTYKKNLQALQYDMLYGNGYVYKISGGNPPVAEDLKMGVNKIKIDKVVKIGEKYYIKGQNFTEYSKVNLDGKILDTVYLGPTILGVSDKEDVKPEDAARMKISQVEKHSEILSTTE